MHHISRDYKDSYDKADYVDEEANVLANKSTSKSRNLEGEQQETFNPADEKKDSKFIRNGNFIDQHPTDFNLDISPS